LNGVNKLHSVDLVYFIIAVKEDTHCIQSVHCKLTQVGYAILICEALCKVCALALSFMRDI